MDGRYMGEEQEYTRNTVMMAACNPYKKLEERQDREDERFVNEKKEVKLAFDVLPAPHALLECMWNYGSLTHYEYEKYIGRMLEKIDYKGEVAAAMILQVHQQIGEWLYESAVSLRDIDRFRQLYAWFKKYLPRNLLVRIDERLGNYNDISQRSFILALEFTYILRFSTWHRVQLEAIIEEYFGWPEGFMAFAKSTEEEDLCARLNFEGDTPVALNASLKENLYACFVCVNTHLPLLIIGAPGSSKSLSLSMLEENLKEIHHSKDDHMRSKFKPMKGYNITGSENTTTDEIKVVFEKVYATVSKSLSKRKELKEVHTVIFDEIGLAENSEDNPLKVLHPYLEVTREDQLNELSEKENKEGAEGKEEPPKKDNQKNNNQRQVSFIAISNSELDVSKMSRLLVLRRPSPDIDDLKLTAVSIAEKYMGRREGLSKLLKHVVNMLTESYAKFLERWKAKKNNFPLFFGLRDFYCLVKQFAGALLDPQIAPDDHEVIVKVALSSIFSNFNGWEGSFLEFRQIFL
jgi:hypothetical protein